MPTMSTVTPPPVLLEHSVQPSGDPVDREARGRRHEVVTGTTTSLDTAARVVRPDGWFSFSLLHPCFPGLRTDTSEQQSSWPPDLGYAAEGWWTTHGDGVRGRVGANHRMLSTYLNAVLRAGFELEELAEPAAKVPRFLLVRCRRRA